ncbi:MAG: hypothetical protein NTZ49_02040 [Candidatus Parcubacteria bacterium]|nr:hypothetical protein [Candidatus Parcubacteria bacterium]
MNEQNSNFGQNNYPQNIYNMPEDGRRKSGVLFIVLGVVIFLLVAGIVSAGYYYYAVINSPENIVKQMLANMAEVKSYQTKINADIIILAPDRSINTGFFNFTPDYDQVKFNANILGKIDNLDANNKKADLALTFKTEGLGEADTSYAFDVKVVNKMPYFRMQELPAAYKQMLPPDLVSLENQWIKIDIAELEKQYADYIKEIEKSQGEVETKLTDEQLKEIAGLINKYQLFGVEKLKDEAVNNVNTYHFKYTLNKEEFKKFLIEFVTIFKDNLPEEMLDNFDKAIETFSENFDKTVTGLTGELWIGKKDKLLYKYTAISEINSAEKKVGSLEFTQEFSDFNQKIDITEPENVMTLKEVIDKVMSLMQGNSTMLDSDLDGLPDAYEATYGTDPLKPDTDGDGYPDKEEIEKGYNPNGPGKLETQPVTITPKTPSLIVTPEDSPVTVVPETPSVKVSTCRDTDGGIDYYLKGTIIYANNPDVLEQYDSCDNTALIETVCNSQTDYTKNTQRFLCPNGCNDGACVVKCTGINMVWPDAGRSDPYTYATDSCDGYRCLDGNSISPSCYSYRECIATCKQCINISAVKGQCL